MPFFLLSNPLPHRGYAWLTGPALLHRTTASGRKDPNAIPVSGTVQASARTQPFEPPERSAP